MAALLFSQNSRIRFRGEAPRLLIKGPRACQGGFSLMEVTVTLGIISFAFISILGLLPLGLTTFHSAIDISVGSQISQCVMNDLQEGGFNTLASATASTRYFDNQGVELPPKMAGAVYQVKTHVAASPVLPGASDANSSLASVVIQIAYNPANQSINQDDTSGLWTNTPGVNITSYSTLVAGISTSSGDAGTN